MKGVSDYVVVYDISSNKERGKIDRILKGFGFRTQKSVFECKMNKKGKRELIERLDRLIIKTGFIKIYRLEYSSKNEIIGVSSGKAVDDDSAFII